MDQNQNLDFSQDPLLPLESYHPDSQPSYLFPSATWPLLLPQNMSHHNSLHTDSTSNQDPASTSPELLDIKSNMSSPMAPSHHSPQFTNPYSTADSSSHITTSGSMGLSPAMASSMTTLQLAGFNNGVPTTDSNSSPDTLTTTLGIRTSTGPSMTPLQTADLAFQQAFDTSATMLASHFQMGGMLGDQQSYTGAGMDSINFSSNYDLPLHSSPTDDYGSTTQADLSSLLVSSSMQPMGIDALSSPQFAYAGYSQMANWPGYMADMQNMQYANHSVQSTSPEHQHYLETRSFSTGSDNSWTLIDHPQGQQSFDSFSDCSNVVSPPQTLHVRTDSDSSHHSDNPPLSAHSIGSYDEIFAISPEPEAHMDHNHSHSHSHSHGYYIGQNDHDHSFPSPPRPSPMHAAVSTPAIPITASHSPLDSTSSSSSSGSPKTKRRTSPTGVTAKTIAKKKTVVVKTGTEKPEKRIGRRRGPLRPEQRQQAHEIRKLRACLRCKFLKKVCDKGDPCGGCQPSHARLWQVPCTRIDIKDINFFLKGWNADYERHVTLEFSVANIKGFSSEERVLFVTHGYGFFLPISARQVYVRDEKCFGVDWTESIHETPRGFGVTTATLSAGAEGISRTKISEYIDLHLNRGFNHFVDEYFEGTPFLSELLKSIHRYYLNTKQPNIRKGLKLVIAYALTLHITMVDCLTEEEAAIGKIEDPGSRWFGKTCAPVMINFQVKKAMADMWRELMKDVLEELSALYSSVYNGEKFKNWPTIFMLAALILSVWEMMQFDSHYRVPDEGATTKFCSEMENVPVGVIVGLFSAISTKLPNFLEWDTQKHGTVWQGNAAICETMTEVRSHVEKHEPYLRTRNECKFEREDFDCLSNKFLSKLVIRAN